MKKIVYESPWAESLPLVSEQSVCLTSFELLELATEEGFDDDSD